jgi:hypothetical protein
MKQIREPIYEKVYTPEEKARWLQPKERVEYVFETVKPVVSLADMNARMRARERPVVVEKVEEKPKVQDWAVEMYMENDSWKIEAETPYQKEIIMHEICPEIVTRNAGFFDTMATIGYAVPGYRPQSSIEPHQRRFYVLKDVEIAMLKNEPVVNVTVPPLGCDILKEKLYSDSSICHDGDIHGNTENVVYAAREKIDGEEVVVFSIETTVCKRYFKWESKELEEVEATVEFQAERKGMKYYVLSPLECLPIVKKKSGEQLDLRMHEWEEMTTDLIDEAQEGLVVLANYKEHKVVRVPTYTLLKQGDRIVDSTRKMQIVIPEEIICDGLHDIIFENDAKSENVDMTCTIVGRWQGELVYHYRQRKDKVYPDSVEYIEMSRTYSMRYSRLKSVHKLRKGRTLYEDKPRFFRASGSTISKMRRLQFPSMVVDIDKSVDRILECERECLYLEHPARLRERPGERYKGEVEERQYVQNVRGTSLIASFVHTATRTKTGMSQLDLFLMFKSQEMKYKCGCEGYEQAFSAPIYLRSFYSFIMRNHFYIKDGMAYQLVGYRPRVPPQKMQLIIGTKRRKGAIQYRGYYVWYGEYRDNRFK